MSVLRWEDPPTTGRGRARTGLVAHELIAYQLRKRPGEWGVIQEVTVASGAPSLAGDIKAGRYKPYQPAGSFDAVVRKVNDVVTVYARYVGQVS